MFRLPTPPSANNYKRHYCTGKTNASGEHIVSAALTKRARAYKNEAGWLAKNGGVRMADGPVMVELYVYDGPWPQDAGNVEKVILDSLNGIAWEDDKQVQELHIVRRPGRGDPHVDVVITDMSEGRPMTFID